MRLRRPTEPSGLWLTSSSDSASHSSRASSSSRAARESRWFIERSRRARLRALERCSMKWPTAEVGSSPWREAVEARLRDRTFCLPTSSSPRRWKASAVRTFL